MSRTLSGLFLIGALDRPRKRKRTNRENPRRVPEQIGKSQKNRERTKKDKKGRTSPDRETPPFETPPRLAALDLGLCRTDGKSSDVGVGGQAGILGWLSFLPISGVKNHEC